MVSFRVRVRSSVCFRARGWVSVSVWVRVWGRVGLGLGYCEGKCLG